jgi:hypothetical protein
VRPLLASKWPVSRGFPEPMRTRANAAAHL